jgi:hypothetical protein
MSHVYEVKTSDGKAYDVTTPHHHQDHDAKAFLDHLLDVLKGAAGGVISGTIVHYAYKGRR